MLRTGLPEAVAAIATAVVGHDPLDRDAMSGEPRQRAFEKRGGGILALVRQDLAVGQPAGVIDADMQALPTDAVMAIDHARLTPGDAMTDALDPAEFLGVQMQQFAGTRPFIAYDRDGWVERLQAIEAEPAKDLGHARDRQAKLPRDPGELVRCRRNRSIAATVSAAVSSCGLEAR
jgi:hypothetical protein